MKFILSPSQGISRTRSLLSLHWGALAIIVGLVNLFPLGGAETSSDPKKLPLPKRVVVPKLHGSVKVDGELSESVWKKAAVLKPFYQNDGSGREREHTEVRLWYDDTALYLAWICQDADIQATFTQHDSKFWE